MDDRFPRYLIDGRLLDAHDPQWQSVLAAAHGKGSKPKCLCRAEGVPMYVARYADYVIKRLPDTGHDHHPTCPSYESPAAHSGLGEVLGESIIERAADRIEVRLDFPLVRRVGRTVPLGEPGAVQTAVSSARRKLGLRGLTHLLFLRAGLHRWYPRMQGKRSWHVVRRHLQRAAQEIETKGDRLADILHMPEPFRFDDADGIAQRRALAFAGLLSPGRDVQFKLMLVIGELKDFAATDIDYRIVLKHMPDFPLYMAPKAGDRFKKVFEREHEAWVHQRFSGEAGDNATQRLRFLFTGLVYAKRENVYSVDTASLMIASATWIPLDHPYEQPLVDALVAQQRRFLKPLRFESKRGAAFPNLVLLDAGEQEIALDIVTPMMTDKDLAMKEAAIARRQPKGWVWRMDAGGPVPQLPDPSGEPQSAPAEEPGRDIEVVR